MKQSTESATRPRILSFHELFDGKILASRFLTRFGETVWMVDEVEPDGLLGKELFQGDRAGAVRELRRLAALAGGGSVR